MLSNNFSSFWSWLESCLTWFISPTLLSDPFVSLIVKSLEFTFGIWLLYILIMKPILMLLRYVEKYIYRW